MMVSSALFTKTVPALEMRDIVLNVNCLNAECMAFSTNIFNLFTSVSQKIDASMISHNIPALH